MGFKWFVDGLLDGSIGFGGEESAGASFLRRDGGPWSTDKDGLIPCLLAAEMTARDGRDPARATRRSRSASGPPSTSAPTSPRRRRRRPCSSSSRPTRSSSAELAGEPITDVLTEAPGNGASIGGLKVASEGGWFAARPSGTEDVYKVYAGVVPRRGAPRADRRRGAGDREGRARRMSEWLAPVIGLVLAAALAGGALLLIRRPVALYSEPERPPVHTGRRVVVIGGGFGGIQAIQKLRKHENVEHHADRPPQLPPLPAARLPGRDRRALAGRDRHAAAGGVQARRQRARAARRGGRDRPRAARCGGAAADPRRADPRGALRLAARRGGSKYSYFGHDEWERVAPEVKSLEHRDRGARPHPRRLRGGRARGRPGEARRLADLRGRRRRARPASRWRARSPSSRATRCRATSARSTPRRRASCSWRRAAACSPAFPPACRESAERAARPPRRDVDGRLAGRRDRRGRHRAAAARRRARNGSRRARSCGRPAWRPRRWPGAWRRRRAPPSTATAGSPSSPT